MRIFTGALLASLIWMISVYVENIWVQAISIIILGSVLCGLLFADHSKSIYDY